MLKSGVVKNGRYKVIRHIGRGGSSNVYLCFDNHINKEWAMKVIDMADNLGMSLASREIEMLKSIDYQMFPRIVDAFSEGNALYIISDYVEGISLDRVLKAGGINRQRAYKWLSQICLALNYLHGLSPPILYLDLKPENIILKSDGELAMIDFGIAARLAGSIIPMGTPGYAAPEQYSVRERNPDERTDIYALGKLYYAIRSGKRPDKNSKRDLDIISSSDIFNKKERIFISKCICEDASGRYQSTNEALRAISNMNSGFFTARRIFSISGIVLSIISISLFIYQRQKKEMILKESAIEMINKAQPYMENGEYTAEGIKIIESYINVDCLETKAMESFAFEVARNYFEIQKDYKAAKRYFSKISEDEYPEKKYYLELCRLMSAFDFEEERVLECVGRLYGETYRIKPCKRKYDNIMLVSEFYENYSSDEIEGIKKAVTVLEEGLTEIADSDFDESDYQQIQQIKGDYEERIDFLTKKAQIFLEKTVVNNKNRKE